MILFTCGRRGSPKRSKNFKTSICDIKLYPHRNDWRVNDLGEINMGNEMKIVCVVFVPWWVCCGFWPSSLFTKLNFSSSWSLLVPQRFRKQSWSVRKFYNFCERRTRNHGEVEQDNEKEKEQFDSLEGLHTQGTRELWQFLSFDESRASCPGSTGQFLVSVLFLNSPAQPNLAHFVCWWSRAHYW